MEPIRRVASFLGPRGERVEALIAINPTTNEDLTAGDIKEMGSDEPPIVFAGVATLMSAIPTPQGPVPAIPNEIRFPILADDLESAISQYPDELQSFIDNLKKEQEQAQQKRATEELYVPSPAESEAINNLKITE